LRFSTGAGLKMTQEDCVPRGLHHAWGVGGKGYDTLTILSFAEEWGLFELRPCLN
jgi:hypothetical protein